MSQYSEWRVLSTGQVSDAMDALALPRNVITGIAPLSEAAMPLVGRAFTLQQIRVVNSRAPGPVRHAEAAKELASEGEVIVIDAGGFTDVCTWGFAHSMRAAIRGIAGVLVNGAVRDSVEIRESGFPLFCRGRSPVKSTGNFMTTTIGEPLSIGGAVIRKGDLIFGDLDGIVCVPAEHENEVFKRAMDIHKSESARDAELRQALAQKLARH
jgi:regulator of RNase E activity RraA